MGFHLTGGINPLKARRSECAGEVENWGLPPHLLYRVRLTLLETSWEVSFIQTASPPFVLAISDPVGYHDDIVHIIARACGNVNRYFWRVDK